MSWADFAEIRIVTSSSFLAEKSLQSTSAKSVYCKSISPKSIFYCEVSAGRITTSAKSFYECGFEYNTYSPAFKRALTGLLAM